MAACMMLAAVPAVAQVSEYTSVAQADCQPPSQDRKAIYEALDLGVEACRAWPGIELLLVSSDRSSWFDIVRDGRTWTTETAVAYDQPFGDFPNVGAAVVEWRLDQARQPTALIFRVAAQAEKSRSTRLFVVRLETEAACLLGRAITNEEARALADGSQSCNTVNRLPLRPGSPPAATR